MKYKLIWFFLYLITIIIVGILISDQSMEEVDLETESIIIDKEEYLGENNIITVRFDSLISLINSLHFENIDLNQDSMFIEIRNLEEYNQFHYGNGDPNKIPLTLAFPLIHSDSGQFVRIKSEYIGSLFFANYNDQ